MGVQQRSSQSSVNKGPQQTLSEIQRGMVARKFFVCIFFCFFREIIFTKNYFREIDFTEKLDFSLDFF